MEDFGMDWNGSGSHDAFDRYMDMEVMRTSGDSSVGGRKPTAYSHDTDGQETKVWRVLDNLAFFLAIVFMGVISAMLFSPALVITLPWVGIFVVIAILVVIRRSLKS